MSTPRLIDLFVGHVHARPEAPALYDGHAGTRPPEVMTRQQLHDLAVELTATLRAMGVEDGDCVGVWLPNWSSAVAAQLAALCLGAHVIGINTRYNSDEVAHVLLMARPRVLLVAHEFMDLDLLGRLQTAARTPGVEAPQVLVVAAPAAQPPTDAAAYDVGAGAQAFRPRGVGGSLTPHSTAGLCTAFTTSGSTGKSKLAAHDEPGVTLHSLAVAERTGIGAEHVVLAALPLSGVFGFTPSMAALLSGGAVLLEPVFDANGVLVDMATCKVTHAAGGDDLFGRLAAAWPEQRPRLALEWVGIADFEGRSKQVAAWAEGEFGASVVGVYGSSEIFALASFWSKGDPEERRRSGGGHLVSDAIEVRIVDPLSGAPVGAGAEGEMQFRGPNVVDAYLGDPALAEGTFTEDGWFRSGDLGRIVGKHSIEYLCRMGDVLRLRGFLVDPAEIEVRLVAHPAVSLAKVVGVPGPTGATVAVGFVMVEDGATAPGSRELRDWCAQTLAKFKIPAEVYVVDQMPSTSGTNGTKIKAATLREIAAARVAAGSS